MEMSYQVKILYNLCLFAIPFVLYGASYLLYRLWKLLYKRSKEVPVKVNKEVRCLNCGKIVSTNWYASEMEFASCLSANRYCNRDCQMQHSHIILNTPWENIIKKENKI